MIGTATKKAVRRTTPLVLEGFGGHPPLPAIRPGMIHLSVACACGFDGTPLGDCSHLDWPNGDGDAPVLVITRESCGEAIAVPTDSYDEAFATLREVFCVGQ